MTYNGLRSRTQNETPGGHMAEPAVSIGIPVFNGENFLEATLDSLLSQTFGDFEIVISDNASTDRTEDLVRDVAAGDTRIRYVRQPRNLGAAPNYNTVFQLSRAPLFKWAAHDDVCEPEFVQRCVDALRKDEEAVGAFPLSRTIGVAGEPIRLSPSHSGLTHARANARLESVLAKRDTFPVFGVYRREAVERTSGHGGYTGSDRILLAELALAGRLIEVPERLFRFRIHPEQSIAISDGRLFSRHHREAWFDTSRDQRIVFPYWRRAGGFISAVRQAPLTSRERTRCMMTVLGWAVGSWKGLGLDVLAAPVQAYRRLTDHH